MQRLSFQAIAHRNKTHRSQLITHRHIPQTGIAAALSPSTAVQKKLEPLRIGILGTPVRELAQALSSDTKLTNTIN